MMAPPVALVVVVEPTAGLTVPRGLQLNTGDRQSTCNWVRLPRKGNTGCYQRCRYLPIYPATGQQERCSLPADTHFTE
jgi:hypothetical protein